MDPIEAGHKGSKEIYFAIISTTITLAAVFLPIIFLQGLTGRLFREFGIVVAGCSACFGSCFPNAYSDDEFAYAATTGIITRMIVAIPRSASTG